jgi:hypothetical protein
MALALGAAGLAVSATALAATTPWQPLFGDGSSSPQPRITADAPPAGQLNALGVLRRDQTDDDRGAVTQRALRFFGTSTQDVNTGYIRRLPAGGGGLDAVLLPVGTWQVGSIEKHNAICLFVADSEPGGSKGCFTGGEVVAGQARGSLGSVDFGLVPDGVASVAFHYGATTRTEPVQENFYEHRAPEQSVAGGGTTSRRPDSVAWLDAQGSPTHEQPSSF